MKSLSALGLALALTALISAPALAAGPNLLVNPGFEANGGSYDGWPILFGSGPNISTAATDNIFQSGQAASKIFGEFLGCPFGSFTVGGYGQLFTPVVGETYEFSGSSFVSSADTLQGTSACDGARAVAKVVFFDAASAGNEIASNEIVIGSVDSPLDTWVDWSISLPAPTGALRVECLILFLQPVCEEGSVFVDDLVFRVGDAPAPQENRLTNPSFSTAGLAGWQGFGNVFEESVSGLYRTPGAGAKMFGTFVADSPSVLTQATTVTPGETVELSAYMLKSCNDAIEGDNANFVLGRVEFYDASTNLIGEAEATFLDASSPAGTWVKQSIQADVPAGAASGAVFFLFIQPDPAIGGAAWIDDVSFGEAPATAAPIATRGFVLDQNEPNPFNPTTSVRFTLDRGSAIDLQVYDLAGRHVATLARGEFPAGPHVVTWNGRNDDGRTVASGVYRYVLQTAEGASSRSMVLLK